METAVTTETPAAPAADQPAAAPTLAEVKAARRAPKAAAPKTDNTLPAPGVDTGDAKPKPAAAAPAPKPVEPPAKPAEAVKIDMDEKSLSQFTQLSKDVRETKEKLKAAEAKLAEFANFEKARGLAKDGKHYDAARAAGIDVDAALAELLQANPGQQASPELLTLKKEIEALKAKGDEAEKAHAAAKAAEAEASLKNDRTVTGKVVADSAAKYPHLAKAPELVDAAFKDFTDSRSKLEKENGSPLPGDEQAKLLLAALDVHEEKWAKVFGTKPAETPAAGLDASVRAAPTPAAKQPERMTFAQVKAARRAAMKR